MFTTMELRAVTITFQLYRFAGDAWFINFFSIYCLRVVLMSFLAIPHNGKFCDPSACFLKNKKDGVACRPSCRHTANPAACSIAGRKSWNKTLLSATSLHAANLMLVSARYFIPPPFSGKFFLELFSGEWTENNSNN